MSLKQQLIAQELRATPSAPGRLTSKKKGEKKPGILIGVDRKNKLPLDTSRTQTIHTYPVSIRRPDMSKVKPESRKYRNPVIYAQELHDEMVRDDLTRKQLAARHGVSSDRITQWLCLLKLPAGKLREIEALGDYWERRVITEHQLRDLRRGHTEIHNHLFVPVQHVSKSTSRDS